MQAWKSHGPVTPLSDRNLTMNTYFPDLGV